MSPESANPQARDPEWRAYERAVAELLAAFQPGARVLHDATIPDALTGNPRQRDVWIETRFAGVIPIRIFVSCKHWSEPLSEQDMDAVNGEFLASGAHVGIAFSLNGFSSGAIAKAKAVRINCCKAYFDQPVDLPDSLRFDVYCCSPQLEFGAVVLAGEDFAPKTYREFLEHEVNVEGRQLSILDMIVEDVRAGELSCIEAVGQPPLQLPQPWSRRVSLHNPSGRIEFTIGQRWRWHRAKLEAYRVRGIYSISEGRFEGRHTLPVVDLRSMDPGPGWEPIDPITTSLNSRVAFYIRHDADVRGTLLEHWGDRPMHS